MTRNLTRREVLGVGLGMAGAALAIGALGFDGLRLLSRPSPLVEATYPPLVGSIFTVGTAGNRIDLKLTGTRSLGPLQYGGSVLTGKQKFALDFDGPTGLASGTQTLFHPALGNFQLFINPVGQTGAFQRYEVVINTYDVNIGRRIDV